jgi:integrase
MNGRRGEEMGKRGNGEGSIWRRKGGGWCAQYTVYTSEGRKRRTLYGKTRQEVAAKLSKALADREGGLTFDAGSLTVGEYLARWLSHSVRDTVSQKTYERYESIVRVHLSPALGRIRLKALTSDHVRGLYREKLDSGLAPRTVLHIHRTLSKALKQATDDGLIPRNAAASVKPPQARREEMQPLSRDQVRMFLDTVKGDRMEALYVLAVTSGLRQGELLALKWEDVDLEGTNPTLEVRRSLSETRGRRSFVTPKSGRGRHLRLSKRAASVLRVHRKRQLEERVRKAGLWEDHGLIFPSEVGTPMSGRNLYRAFKIRVKRASLPQTLRFHDLRHTCATLLLRQGINPKFVQELLGHADISLTLNTYSHVLPDMGDAAASGMDAALG